MRSTCAGEAPSAAAAWAGRPSSDSQEVPTARITTATLKKTRPLMIARGVPSQPRNASGPPGANRCRIAAPTTTVGNTKGTNRAPRIRRRPGKSSRYKAYAAGRASTTERRVATLDDHTVNQTTRCTRGRASTSTSPAGSNPPAPHSPRASIPPTGRRKNTPRTSSGTAASAISLPIRDPPLNAS